MWQILYKKHTVLNNYIFSESLYSKRKYESLPEAIAEAKILQQHGFKGLYLKYLKVN